VSCAPSERKANHLLRRGRWPDRLEDQPRFHDLGKAPVDAEQIPPPRKTSEIEDLFEEAVRDFSDDVHPGHDGEHGEIAAGHDAIFATIYKGTVLHAEIDHIRFVRPDVAVLDVEHHLTDAAGVTFPPGHTHGIAVAERTPVGWQIVAFQNMLPTKR
jgi:uncharacterized protein (TIGR02246 family)